MNSLACVRLRCLRITLIERLQNENFQLVNKNQQLKIKINYNKKNYLYKHQTSI